MAGLANDSAFKTNRSIKEALDIKVFLLPAPPEAQAAERTCPRVPDKSIPKARVQEITPDQKPSLRHCDVLYVELANRGDNPVDLTVLYFNADAGINPYRAGGPVRLVSCLRNRHILCGASGLPISETQRTLDLKSTC